MNALTTTLYQLLADNLPLRANKLAVIDGKRGTTYGELAAEVDRLASYLHHCGIKSGDRVIVQLRKDMAEVAAMFAIAKVGAVVVNANVQCTLEQLAYVADDCGAKLLIVEQTIAQALSLLPLPVAVRHVLSRGKSPNVSRFDQWDNAHGHPIGEVPRLDTDLAMIIYTSGSTGKPKGVMLSHRNIIAGARSVARYLKLREDDRLLSVLPYSFDYGLNQLTTMMLMGGTIVHQPVVMATEIVRAIERHEVTGLAAVPPLWNQIVRLLSERPATFPTLRRITNSGGKIPLNVLKRMPDVFPGVDIYLMYGLTEAFRSTYLPPQEFKRKMGSIGRAIPGAEIYVVKSGAGIASPGEQGELVHRGPLVSMGYWGNPEATREKLRPCPELARLIGDEPVVYSGDIVELDAEGDLWFVGRNDAMIKTSGFRVSPDEIEDLVCRSGMVADAVAFGINDNDRGQLVHVAVTPLPGFTEAALLRHCQRVMPHYMIPSRIHVWQEPMPRTASGKLARPDVRRHCDDRLRSETPMGME